jgi:hypothetical protein
MLALEALARRGVGFGLSGSLRQQAQRLFGGGGHGFFNVPQVFFRMLLDGLQARRTWRVGFSVRVMVQWTGGG